MPTYRVQYVEGYGHATRGDQDTLVANGFDLGGDGMWMDFYDGRDAVILRVRAEHVLRIELVQNATPRSSDEFDPEDDELAG